MTRDREKGNKDSVSECRVLRDVLCLRPGSVLETGSLKPWRPTSLAASIHPSRAFHASSHPFNLASDRASSTTGRDSVRRDTSRSHSTWSPLVTSTTSRGTCRTSAMLEGGGSSECGMLLERPKLIRGLGKTHGGAISRLRVRDCAVPGTAGTAPG